jgi:RNA polymerase-binding transcription factor DksA
MESKANLGKKDLKELEKKLLEERAQIERELKELEEDLHHHTQSEISGEDIYEDEYAESGSATFEREKDLSIELSLKDTMEQINRALERIKNDTYGICQRCQKPIEIERLRAIPYAELCIQCKKKEEKSSL